MGVIALFSGSGRKIYDYDVEKFGTNGCISYLLAFAPRRLMLLNSLPD
jgi:hypothetical protein